MSLDETSLAPITMPIATLAPDPVNPRDIGPGALEGLGISIREFGDLSGIVFNVRTKQLVCGHQRVRALADAGAAEWRRDGDAAWVEHPDSGERFAIRLVDWDETRQRMANLVANNPEIGGHYTEAALDQIKSLENEIDFSGLMLPELEAKLAREFKRAEEQAGADANAPEMKAQYLVMVTCESDRQQAQLLEELAKRGLKVRALIQ